MYKCLSKNILGSSFPLNPNHFIFRQLIEYLNYLVDAMLYMPCLSLAIVSGEQLFSQWQDTAVKSFQSVLKFVTKHQSAQRLADLTPAMTLTPPACMDLTGAAKQPLFCPRPSASSAVLSPSLCAFHAAPSLSAAECHPRPLPVRFIKPVGDEVKA